MRLLKNDILVHKNETFTLGFDLINKDGSPYILYNKLSNPHLLITIASSKYEEANRYVLNLWLDLSELPSFENTIPKEVDTIPVLAPSKVDEYVYYVKNDKKYVYYSNITNKYVDYKFTIRCPLTSDITNKIVGQSYWYSVQLLTGKNLKEYLTELCDKHNIDKVDSVIIMYNRLKDAGIIDELDLNVPLVEIYDNNVILPATNYTVQSNIHGGIKWI